MGLALNWYFMGQNRKELLEKQRQQQEQEAEQTEPADEEEPTAPDEPVDPDSPDSPDETPEGPEVEAATEETLVELATESTAFVFTNYGGGISYTKLTDQFAVGEEDKKVRLNRFGPEPIGRLWTSANVYLDIVYEHEEDKQTDRSVSFLGKTADGLYIRKTWTLVDDNQPGSNYRLKLDLTFENHSEEPVALKDFGLFTGSAAPLWEGERANYITLFYNNDGKYKKRAVSSFKKGKKGVYQKDAGTMRYAGVANQFFATIVAPKEPYDAWIWGDREGVYLPAAAGGGQAEAIRLGMSLPDQTLATEGGKAALEFEVFTGPKRNRMLRRIGMDRGEVMNYTSFLGIGYISRGLNWLLNVLHTRIFGPLSDGWSWGLSIVALTIIIRTVMWPLQNKGTRAMKRMSKLQPQMTELREKYGDDPQKMNQEMMKMYREYGINPVGGCLPLVVQIPIFFGFFTMLMYAVELRQQSFLWVDDLSLPDTLFHLPFSIPFLGSGVNPLPIVMAATMVLQMALTPKTGDKMQRRLFMLMPVIFFFFCYNFASALALYWTTSNIFAIVQMLITQRLPEPELKKKKGGKAGGKSFFQKLQERAEEAQKAQKAQRAKAMGGRPPKKPKKRGPRTGG